MVPVEKCNLCSNPETFGPDSEVVFVRSNIRRFRDESFAVWRCGSCRSIHARDDVDLDHYYSFYPFFKHELDWGARAAYRNLLRRLKRAGLRRDHTVLDYGCGGGVLVEYMRSKGFERVVGYDGFSPEFGDRAALDAGYDCLVSQDVIEHVAEPRELLRTFDGLVRPGGLVAIGTPNADGVDLNDAERYVHTLHQPYHTHMVSKNALLELADDLGWELVRLYPTSYVNTLFPFINHNFGLHYGQCFDNCLDLAFEDFKFSPKLLTPRALYLIFFGYFRHPLSDMMAIFRTAGA